MSFDPNKLTAALADPSIAALSDADASAALSAPILTPRTGKITYATLASTWGPIAADGFYAALTTAKAAPDPMGAFARSALRVIDSVGFDASDPQSVAVAGAFVVAGLATQDQVNGIFYDAAYRCGDVVTTQDIVAARAAIALDAAYVASAQVSVDSYNGVRAWMQAKRLAGDPAPSREDVLAKMGAAQ